MTTTRIVEDEDVALDIQQEAMRLIGVASMHRAKLLREKDDPDPRLQRGNASSFSHTEGVVCGMARVLRSFGFPDLADQVEYALDEMCDEVVPADAARRVEPPCTCTYAAYAGYAGGTGWDIARYDPNCPQHANDGMAELERAVDFEEWSR